MNDGAVGGKRLVSGQQNEFLDLGLCDQHPIKRIAVAPSKQGDLPGVGGRQWQALEGFGGQPLGEVDGEAQFPRLCLSQISQRETALTNTVFSGSRIISLA